MLFNYLIKAKEFSVHKFYNFLKSQNFKVSKNTIYNYFDYFHDAFVFFPLRKFSLSLKKIEQSIPKIYTVDNGLIENIIGNDKSKKLENLVFLTLLREKNEINKDVFYYISNNKEVDFIVKRRDKVLMLIQTCFDIGDYQTKDREVNSLIKAGEELKCDNLIVVTYYYEKVEKVKNKKIKFIPFWKFILDFKNIEKM